MPSQCSRRRGHSRLLPALLASALSLAAPTGALAVRQASVRTDLPNDGFVERTRAVAVSVDGAFDPATQRLAVFIDRLDVTALLMRTPAGWLYDGSHLPLPTGEHELVAYIIDSDDTWTESLRQPFRVPGALGIEDATFEPSLDLGLKSRLASAFEPAAPNERETYNDLDGRFGFDTEVTRHGGLRFAARTQFVGASEQNRALRFGQLADDAPRIDLSSYVMQVRQGAAELAVGNVAAGDARHLIRSFSSRGAALGLNAGSRVQFSAAALHGSNLVGWDDLIGVSEPDHRILTGTIGFEALAQPGALRVDVTAMDGSVLPQSGFNRGAITDAETSTGIALRVQSQAFARRLRFEGGFTRSTFDNPEDPTLAGDTTLVDVEAETRDARYVTASLDVLRGLRIGKTRTVRLTVGFEHERVDPLFRTVASYTRADQQENRWEARADVAGVSLSLNHARSRNNLDEIESILTSLTHRTGVDLALPLSGLVGRAVWLPQLRFRTDRTHQFGRGVPVNGGFAASHVPDQVSTDHTASMDMRFGPASIGYRLNLSEQDNRQVGRENADLERTTHGVTLAGSPVRSLSLNADLAWIDALSRERDETDATRRIGLGIRWMPLREAVLALDVSDTHSENDGTGSSRDDRTWSVQWNSPIPGLTRLGGKALLRFARTENRAGNGSDSDIERRNWMVDAGFNFSFR